MALVITHIKDADNVVGKFRTGMFDVTLPSSYTTGGDSFAAADLPGQMFKHIFGVRVVGANAVGGSLLVNWDSVNKKLMAWYPSGDGTADAVANQVGSTDDIDAFVVRLEVTGY